MSQIFISYRRQDQSHAAGRLYDELAFLIGRERIFMDVDAIPPGVDFVQVLEEKVASCEVLLAIIGSGWVDAKDELGRRRLDRIDDFVRIEIAAALKRRISVVPVLMDGAHMPDVANLPDDLKPLARRQATVLSHRGFKADVLQLVKQLALRPPDRSEGRYGTPTFPLLTNARIKGSAIEKFSPTEQDVVAALDDLASGLSEFVVFSRGVTFIQAANRTDSDYKVILPATFVVEVRINLNPKYFGHFLILDEGMKPDEEIKSIGRVKQLFLAWINSQQLPSDVTLIDWLDGTIVVRESPS